MPPQSADRLGGVVECWNSIAAKDGKYPTVPDALAAFHQHASRETCLQCGHVMRWHDNAMGSHWCVGCELKREKARVCIGGDIFETARNDLILHQQTELDYLQRAERAESLCDELAGALREASPYIEFYAKREMESPSNNQEAIIETREMLSKVRSILSGVERTEGGSTRMTINGGNESGYRGRDARTVEVE